MSKATAEYVTARAVDLKSKSSAAFKIAISNNPDRVRAMLNLWFVPKFKPTFYDEENRYAKVSATASGLDDIVLLDSSYSSAAMEPGGQETQYPVRMIDIDTKNLVEYPNIGPRGQYCILSHSWKGREVNYKYIDDAKFMTFNQELAAAEADKTSKKTSTSTSTAKLNDIDTIKHQCQRDIDEQVARIKALAEESNALSELGLSDASDIVKELLSLRVDVKILEKGETGEGGFQKAKDSLVAALAARDYGEMEGEVFDQFLKDTGLEDDKIQVIYHITNDVTEQLSLDVTKAEEKLNEEKRKQSEEVEKVRFFERHGHVRDAIDELIGRLERQKSVTKVEKSIERSKEIFDNYPFPRTDKRYLWIDSCCINKADDGEYVKSISAMGEWYKNAEFCLIHLDTRRNIPKDPLVDWQVLRSTIDPQSPNITQFRDIFDYQPEWSTRAWTLQELVMSKATFYVNSAWEFLPRPVDTIGPWYHLSPFVYLYTSVDTNNPYSSVLGDKGDTTLLAGVLDSIEIKCRLKELPPEEKSLTIAQKLIAMLEALDFRPPRDIEMETARSRITQSVYIAVSSLTASSEDPASDGKRLLDDILEALHPYISGSRQYSLAERARYAINMLLKCLVSLLEVPIIYDRSYVAAFGKVQNLELWRKGLIRSRFSTHNAMSLLSGRNATVVTDLAYCLMGMLGVRFPVFPAEGLTKALSRLLDEVVISSNDVSVFNWTGKQYGSYIRGRSLYPSLPAAYNIGKDEQRKKKRDEKLAEIVQLDRYEKMTDFLAISGMLVSAITFAKERQKKDIPLRWVVEILRVIKKAEFEQLRPHVTNIGKILKYIETAFDSKSVATPQATNSPSTSNLGTPNIGVDDDASKQDATSPSPLSSFSSQIKTPSLPKEMPSFKAPKFGRKKTEPETAPPKASLQQPFSRGIGGFKSPSLKAFGRKESETSQASVTPTETGTPTIGPDAASLSPPATPSLLISDGQSHPLDEDVFSYIKRIEGVKGGEGEDKGRNVPMSTTPELPAELGKVLAEIPDRKFSKPYKKSEEFDTMISPNPIIVKNSGIEGLFDIQRVVVSMAQPEKLRRQVRNAVSPHQKISGWCVISTGFATVMISFSCPQSILAKELDIVQAVDDKVLKEKSQGTPNDKEDPNRDDSQINQRGAQKPETAWQKTLKDRLKIPKSDNDDKGIGSGEPVFNEFEAEGNKVSRMIMFVQESDLTKVAGEWVLARFSGVPGAKWFLCYLELGGSGRDFYGQRIPTDEIDFHNASPERGLLKYWEFYMMEKKHRLCSILQKQMESKDWGNLKTEMGQNLAKRITKEISGDGEEKGDSEADSDDEDAESSLLKDLGGMALSMAGAGLIQQFYEWRAERLQKSLSADVLKKFPAHIQTAMEALDDNQDLMPSSMLLPLPMPSPSQ
ncbi:hypothetical protein F4818DRAFT_436134 [Hypoxylon cercidicola]|nr:hypothetical protein F4818DRAFT_436134 [Hypoxylon cercidicola]